MNAAAFRRGEAITHLEELAVVIVTHLALVTWFPNASAHAHWQMELSAFLKALKKYNKSKMKKKENFTKEIITDALSSYFETDEDKDNIVLLVESHDQIVAEKPNWDSLNGAALRFADAILS